MKRFIGLVALFTVLMAAIPASGWKRYPAGGGNAEKIIVVDDPVDGAWFFSKDGGACWLPWSGSSWGNWQNFDPYYSWHMGGDVCDIGSVGSTTPYALNVTMQGHHCYVYESGSWGYTDISEVNNYYQYHDGQFFAEDDNDTNTDYFLVATWQHWKPSSESGYNKGIYLISNGSAPASTAPPVAGTSGNWYRLIYRDLSDPQVFYTWGPRTGEDYDFFRVEVYGTQPPFTYYPLTTEFDEWEASYEYDLEQVNGFYQYKVGSTVHQYLLAKTDYNGDIYWDVWHREGTGGSLGASDWDIIWGEVDVNTECEPSDLTARRYIDAQQEAEHYIYTFAPGVGLAMYDTDDGGSFTYTSEDVNDDPIPFLNTHYITRTPWTNDMVILSTPHAGNFFAEVDPVDQEIDDVYSMDVWSSSGGSNKAHSGGRDVHLDGTTLYIATWGIGLFKGDYSGAQPSYSKIGDASTVTPPHNKAYFNFNWNCMEPSPYTTEPDIIYCGAAKLTYKYNGSTAREHVGLWKYDKDAGDDEISEANTYWPVGVEALSINRLLADTDNDWLYVACPDNDELDGFDPLDVEDPAVLYVQTSAGGNFVEVHNTENYRYDISPSWWPSLDEACPNYLCMQVHPNTSNVEGVIYGMGMGALDWAGHAYDPDLHERDDKGGGIGISYKVNNTWPDQLAIDFENHSGTAVSPWFEHVIDMVVEYNSSYYGSIDEWKKVDILAATKAWQMEHFLEDIGRYGGLFVVTYDEGDTRWETEDVTPYAAYNIDPPQVFYKLDWTEQGPFENPAVMSVDKLELGGADPIYFCSTSGEANGTNDDHLSLLWYQQAGNMRDLTRDGWILYPNPYGDDGRISCQYHAGTYYEEWYLNIVAINEDWLTVFGFSFNELDIITDAVIDSDEEWDGEIHLALDVTVKDGATLTLKPDCRVVSLGDYSLTIDSGYVRVQYPDSNRITFTSSDGVRWGGIIFKDIHPDSILTIKNLEIKNAEYGIFVDNSTNGDTVKLIVDNCLFDGNCIGVAADRAKKIEVRNCEIKNSVKVDGFNGDGIYLLNLPTTDNHSVMNCEIHDNEGCGIRMTNCGSNLRLFNNELRDNLGQNDDTPSTWSGIYFYNSTPKLTSNEGYETKGYPLVATHSAAPYFCQGSDSTNIFELDTGEADTFAVIVGKDGFPVLNNARNNFSHNDCDTLYLIKDLTDPQISRKVENNWWGVNPPASSQFYDDEYIDYDPYLTSAEDFPTGLPDRGISSQNAYEILDEGLIALYDGQYLQAYNLLVGLVGDFPEAEEAISMALPHVLNAGANAAIPLSVIYNYFDGIFQEYGESLVGKTARKARNDCSVLMGNYTSAIQDYQSIINSPPNLADSIFALLDANQVNLIMNGLPGIQSMNNPTPLNPVTFENYVKRETDLLELLSLNALEDNLDQAFMPTEFALHQNYPNPFNPATSILYDLPETADVSLKIYNIMGRHVTTLVDRKETAGYKRIIWKGTNRFGGELSSGLYIMQLVSKGESGKKFVKAMKMLLIK